MRNENPDIRTTESERSVTIVKGKSVEAIIELYRSGQLTFKGGALPPVPVDAVPCLTRRRMRETRVEVRHQTAAKVMLGIAVDHEDGWSPWLIYPDQCDYFCLLRSDSEEVEDISGRTATSAFGGISWIDLTEGDTNTLGDLLIIAKDISRYLPFWGLYDVVSKNYWDWKYGYGNTNWR